MTNFKKLIRRTPPKESSVILFGDPKNERELAQSINRVAITGRKVEITPRIKEYEVGFPGDKGASIGFIF
jgi:hypothetical protein